MEWNWKIFVENKFPPNMTHCFTDVNKYCDHSITNRNTWLAQSAYVKEEGSAQYRYGWLKPLLTSLESAHLSASHRLVRPPPQLINEVSQLFGQPFIFCLYSPIITERDLHSRNRSYDETGCRNRVLLETLYEQIIIIIMIIRIRMLQDKSEVDRRNGEQWEGGGSSNTTYYPLSRRIKRTVLLLSTWFHV